MANNSSESLCQAISNKIDSSRMQKIGEKWGIRNELQQVNNNLAAKARAADEDGNGAARRRFKSDAYEKEDLFDNCFNSRSRR